MNNKNNTFFDNCIDFGYMLFFFSILIFAMVGCGGAENPNPPDMPDMMVFNPDAGVDMEVVDEDMGIDSEVDADVIQADADMADVAVEDDMGINDDAGVTDDAGMMMNNDMGAVVPDSGTPETLVWVWIPERVTRNNNAPQNVCENLNGFLVESPTLMWDDYLPEFEVEDIHPFPETKQCGLITNEIVSCEHYSNLALATCTTQANNNCIFPFCERNEYIQNCVANSNHTTSYNVCVSDCQEDIAWRSAYTFDYKAWDVVARGTTIYGALGTGDISNVLCVIPESSVPVLPNGVSGVWQTQLYTGASQL